MNTSKRQQSYKFEPLLESEMSNSLYPIQHDDIWKFYKNHQSTFWKAEEIDYNSDKKEWNELSEDEKHFLKMVLAFFANSDFIVNENLSEQFANIVKYRELQFYYQYQIMAENVHSETYADLINMYIDNEKEKKELFNAVTSVPIIKEKADWCRKYITFDKSDHIKNFVYRLIVFSIVEGLFFSSSFCAIFWMKKQGKLNGLTFSNELISRDEGLHRDLACHLYKYHIVNKLNDKLVIDILKEATELEIKFCKEAIPVHLIGMNADSMCQYVKFVADKLLFELIGKTIYNVKNPFPWMDLISMTNKTNFFERRVGEYSKISTKNQDDNDISFGTDF